MLVVAVIFAIYSHWNSAQLVSRPKLCAPDRKGPTYTLLCCMYSDPTWTPRTVNHATHPRTFTICRLQLRLVFLCRSRSGLLGTESKPPESPKAGRALAHTSRLHTMGAPPRADAQVSVPEQIKINYRSSLPTSYHAATSVTFQTSSVIAHSLSYAVGLQQAFPARLARPWVQPPTVQTSSCCGPCSCR